MYFLNLCKYNWKVSLCFALPTLFWPGGLNIINEIQYQLYKAPLHLE